MVAIINTLPTTTGKSSLVTESKTFLPIPFQLKMFSTNTAPANNDANQPDIAVITGLREFLRACL